MESRSSRYQSRILREMHQNTENPFNSPPSSTGTHGTITLTSNLTMGPQGESTRRMDDISIKLPSQAAMRGAKVSQPTSFNVNTSALGRAFPEWSRWNPDVPEHEGDSWDIESDGAPNHKGKENVTPRGSPNSSVVATPRADDSDHDKVEVAKVIDAPKGQATAATRGAFRTRAQMQPRVQTESECSLDLSEQLAQSQRGLEDHGVRSHMSTTSGAKGSKPRRGNVTALLETLKTAQTKQAETKEQSAKQTSPRSQHLVQPRNAAKIHMERQSGMSHVACPATPNQTARSFILPNFSYINDFLSGTLRLSSLQNGMPVFVKHGKVHDRESTISPDHHVDVEAIAIPEDEENIFVSLDKIKDEIHALKEHDELVSRQAEQFQEEIEDLQIQIAKYKSRKDSAMGSDSDSSIIDHLNSQKSQLEDQVNSLQSRLDKANRKISINEIHTDSYVAERDEALKSSTDHLAKIKELQSQLHAAHEQLDLLRDDNTHDANTLELENKSLRKDNNSIRQQWKSLREENRSLREHNNDISQQNMDLEHGLEAAKVQLDSNKSEFDTLQHEYEVLSEEKTMLKQDNLSLVHHNDKFFNDNKVLKQQNSVLERRTHDLQDEVSRLQKLFDATSAETGTMSIDLKAMMYRLEAKNHGLAKENTELQQHILYMQNDFSNKRKVLEQEKRRLADANERLNQQLDHISKQFEEIVKESKNEVRMYEERQQALTQQLDIVADQESALANKLKKSTDNNTHLRSDLKRRDDAINEARQITQEIKDFMSIASKNKQMKATRIVDPKGKSTASETTARSTTSQTDMPMQDDYTQQIDLTQGSDFASIFTQGEMPKLRKTLRQIRSDMQRKDLTNESIAFDIEPLSDDESQSLPPFLPPSQPHVASSHRTVSGTSKGRTEAVKSQPVGILKDTQPSRLNSHKQKTARTVAEAEFEEQREREKTAESVTGVRKSKSDDTIPRKVSFGRPHIQDDYEKAHAERTAEDSRPMPELDLTGRLSVKSGVSGMSIQSETSEADKFHRRNSDSGRFDVDIDTDHEENMTSALFIDDITLEQQKTTEKKNGKQSEKPHKAELSKDAKRVLDGLSYDHDCGNCTVCTRIKEYHCAKRGVTYKKTIRAEKPVPVSDRASGEPEYEDQSTMRPSESPATALAKVIKTLQDEERHVLMTIKNVDARYNACNPAIHRSQWKKLGRKIDTLRKVRDLRRDQIYFLYDALEGQKASGQEMTTEFVDLTVASAMTNDPSWKGMDEYY